MSTYPRMLACIPVESTEETPAVESHVRALSTPSLPAAEPRALGAPRPVTDLDDRPRAADAIVAALVAAGVETFFGIPGGPVSPIFDAILQHPGARLVESRHETNAAFAAVAYQRVCGRTPAVVVTAGPGATNVVTGLVSAHLEGVPMVVICGDVAWAASGGKLLQDSGPEGIAVEQMLAHVVRRSVRLARPEAAVPQTQAVVAAAEAAHRPGPALLMVPIQLAAARVNACVVDATGAAVQPGAAPVSAELVARVARWLVEAERPLLVLGNGCRAHAEQVRRLVDSCDVPFVTTPKAKGVISEQHPRSLRHGGLAASRWARDYTARGVDVAVALGTDLDDCSVGPTPYIKAEGRLVHVDLDPTVFNRNLPTTLGVQAELGNFAEQLTRSLTAQAAPSAARRAELRELKQGSAFSVPGFREDAGGEQIAPHRALADLEAAVGRDALFVSDIGEHMLFAMHYLTALGPDRFHIQLGLGSMGSGIAGAVGLALGAPERLVVCVCGDGGMQMAGSELLVAARERLPVVYAVFNDARYNMVYHGYRQVYGREASWDTGWVDFAAWARALGVPGFRINRPGEITSRLFERIRMAGGPAVLDIRIDRDVRLAGSGRNEALQHMSMQSDPERRQA